MSRRDRRDEESGATTTHPIPDQGVTGSPPAGEGVGSCGAQVAPRG
jgi:hypothetical protein